MVTTSQAQTTCAMCGKPLAPADVLYTAQALPVCAACFANLDLAATIERGNKRGVIVAGAIAGCVPFAFSITQSSVSTVNGATHVVFRDWVALICGVIAIVLGGMARIGMPRTARKPALFAIAIIVLGVYQLAHGSGVYWMLSNLVNSSRSTDVSKVDDSPAPSVPAARPAPVATNEPATCADGSACFQLGRQLENAKDLANASVAYGRACDFGKSGGCHNAGLAWNQGWGGKVDQARAFAMFQRECELNPLDCDAVAEMYANGAGTAKDLPRALATFQKACDAGAPSSCQDLAAMYDVGDGVPKDAAKTFEFALKACDLTSDGSRAETCNLVGQRLWLGTGIATDLKRAAAYFTKACEQDDKYCFNLGVCAERGEGMAADPTAAMGLYKRACDAKNGDACLNLGVMMRHSKPPDFASAQSLYRRGCDLGAMLACSNLGGLFADGVGVPRDVTAAKALYKQACDGGEKRGCDNLKRLK